MRVSQANPKRKRRHESQRHRLRLRSSSRFCSYKSLLIERYGTTILLFAAVLFINIYAAVYFGVRKLVLNGTGRKLAHVEKQLRTGQSISEELTERFKEHSL